MPRRPESARLTPLTEFQPSFGATLGLAIGVSVLMSTQFLLQPFVWQNWDWSDVMLGWLDILRDDAVIGLAVTASLTLSLRVKVGPLPLKALLIGVAIVLGAWAGQAILIIIGSRGAAQTVQAMLGQVLRWSLIAGGLSLTYYYWRRGSLAAAQLREARRLRAQSERASAAAHLTALRRQIEPHFLFNTLATIRQLYQSGPVEGRRLLSHLLNFVQATLASSPEAFSTLGHEVDLAEAYLMVFKERMGRRLKVTIDVDSGLRDVPFPPFTLATLVENAIKHGISPSPAGGAIRISASLDRDAIEVHVADTGIGFSGESGSGTGLANVRARLRALYADAARCRIIGNEPTGVVASIRIPALRS